MTKLLSISQERLVFAVKEQFKVCCETKPHLSLMGFRVNKNFPVGWLDLLLCFMFLYDYRLMQLA